MIYAPLEVIEGCLLDCYPSRKKRDGGSAGMTFWIKQESGHALKLEDSSWRASIYATGEACEDQDYVSSKVEATSLVHAIKRVHRRTSAFTRAKSPVLQFELSNPGSARSLAELLEGAFQGCDAIQLYNVDVLPEQQYFYEKDLFPLAHVRTTTTSNGEVRSWELLNDGVELLDYKVPTLRCVRLDARLRDRVPGLDSKLDSISLESFTTEEEKGKNHDTTVLESTDEAQILSDSMKEIDRLDPDLVITRNGDSFVIPYLRSKAARYGISLQKLDRDTTDAMTPSKAGVRVGRSYFSYGRILYRPATQRLFGRLHLDEENTFVYDQCRLQGLFEVSRLCRMPMHTSMRASIGKCLSGLQFYHAFREGLLIPWKPEITEDGKNGYELFRSDRGGLVFNPLPGIHEHVFEIDFASLYPSIIRKYNISAETVNCACCRAGSRHQIEELGMHVCEKRAGIVASSLELPLEKRFAYKKLRDSTQDGWLKSVYNERAGALKWILVCCLARESPVLIQRKGGLVQYAKIGDFIDDIVRENTKEEEEEGGGAGVIDCPDGVSVAGVDRNLKVKFCKVRKLIKIPNKQRLLEVTLDDGRRVTATPNHPFYLLKNGVLEVRQASDLQEGNFIPVAKKLPLSPPRRDGGCYTLDAADRPMIQQEEGERISVVASSSANRRPTALTDIIRMFQGDLGFARIRKIEELSRVDDYVYCFQLADDEVPGFFTGEGAVFTHNCFGYLSYRNAKFGKIDSHIAVCAQARKTLLDALHVAERRGFRMIHGIVDSLWIAREGADMDDCRDLCREIEEETGFRLAIEGKYRWIVFLPSKTHSANQVANRYFGRFEDKEDGGKVRGIELRRHDTPSYFKRCQAEILQELYRCDDAAELARTAGGEGVRIFERYARALEVHSVPPSELLIRRRLSKNLDEYSSKRQLQVGAASRLAKRGLELRAGQSVSYVITRYQTSGQDRSIPEEEIAPGDSSSEYDSARYVELLADCCATVLSPFGVTKKRLLARTGTLC